MRVCMGNRRERERKGKERKGKERKGKEAYGADGMGRGGSLLKRRPSSRVNAKKGEDGAEEGRVGMDPEMGALGNGSAFVVGLLLMGLLLMGLLLMVSGQAEQRSTRISLRPRQKRHPSNPTGCTTQIAIGDANGTSTAP